MAADPRSLAQTGCKLGAEASAPRDLRQQAFRQGQRRDQQAGPVDVTSLLGSGFDPSGFLSGAGLGQLAATPGIQSGLAQLTKLSDQIKGTAIGGRLSPINSAINRVIQSGASIEQGGAAILNQLGIGGNITANLPGIPTDLLDNAFSAACSAFESIKSGAFGALAANGALPDLSALAQQIGTSPTATPDSGGAFNEDCDASPYATDLIARAPKFKYQFVVEFAFEGPYPRGDEIRHAFVVKNTTRPNIRYDYEDVNMYNFRTKAIKRMEYEPMTMKFLDDDENRSMDFVNLYYKSMSPIGNLPEGNDGKKGSVCGNMGTTSQSLQENGMDFRGFSGGGSQPAAKQEYSASIGPLRGTGPGSDYDTRQILRRITIYHVFNQGRSMNVYTMFNPKITDIQLDELDHSIGTEGTEVGIQFTYDALHMATNKGFDPKVDEYDIGELDTAYGARWPLRYVDHPGNPPVQKRGLTDELDAEAAKFSGFSGPEFSNIAGNDLVSNIAGPTLDRLTQNLPFSLPGAGDLQAQVQNLAGGLSASIPNLSEVATNAFSNDQFIARAQQELANLDVAKLSGAAQFQVDGAFKNINEAGQILQGRLQKGLDLANNGRIDALRVSLIDRAAGVQNQVEGLLSRLNTP